MLTETDKKIIHRLLKMASDKFSNHGCNDFNLCDLIPDVEMRQALVLEMETANGTPEEFDPSNEYQYVMDWWLMSHMADKVKNN